MTTMDFFGHQARAHRTTRLLVVYYVLAVAAIIGLVYLAAVVLLGFSPARSGAWNPAALGIVTIGVLALVGAAMLYKTSQLRSGGSKVATLLGGRLVDPGTTEPLERRLINVVEEMAIASGVPVPQVFVLDGEAGLNAFAAGWSPQDAAVAVTRGLLEALDRDELQGVIAHEFSHVFHGDMRLNIRLMGVLFGIVCIATIGEVMLRTLGRGSSRRDGKQSGGQIALFGLALMVIGWIGVFFSNLIKAAVSRQREYLADASAVAYTRNPLGIGMALARIGGLGSRLQSGHAREASHLFFADGVPRWLGALGATHPPIEDRIERVLPGFKERLQVEGSMTEAAQHTPPPPVPEAGPRAGVAGFAGSTGRAGVAPADVTGLVGRVEPHHVARAREVLASLPLEVVAAAHRPARARALLYAMLLDPAQRPQQDQVLARCDPAIAHDSRLLALELRALADTARLPLLELLVPALRALPPDQRALLLDEAQQLVMADGRVSTFEFALLKIVRRHLADPRSRPGRRGSVRALAQLPKATELVLSALARVGSDDDADVARAFAAGAAATGLPDLQLRSRDDARLELLDLALDELASVSPMGKKLLLQGCAHTVGADGIIAAGEGELLRALAEHWDCPLPPAWTSAQPAAPVPDRQTHG